MAGGEMARVVAAMEAVEWQEMAAGEGLAQATAAVMRGVAVEKVRARVEEMKAVEELATAAPRASSLAAARAVVARAAPMGGIVR